jgi:hypothetical protein
MAQFQSIGNPVTIAAGATHYWDFWFGPGPDVGAALATRRGESNRCVPPRRCRWLASAKDNA